MCWKTETMLRELPPDQPIEIWRENRPPLTTTARALMREARFPGFMFVDQVEFAFGACKPSRDWTGPLDFPAIRANLHAR